MRKLLICLMAVCAAALLHSCKTTEANYRQAYLIAKEKQYDAGDSLASQGLRNEQLPRTMVIGGVTLPVRTEPLAITKNQDVKDVTLKVYNVVTAKFKQLFNAKSFCARLRENGFNAVVVHNRDVNYFVVAGTTQSPAEAAEILERVRNTPGIVCQAPFPYVLRAAQLVR